MRILQNAALHSCDSASFPFAPRSGEKGETTDFCTSGQQRIDQGNHVMTCGKRNTVERGKHLDVWKLVGGEWKLRSSIRNPNAPASPESSDE